MKILHCAGNLTCGGVQRQLAYLASEQVKSNHEVYIIYFKGDFFVNELKINKVNLIRLKSLHRFDPFVFLQTLYWILKIKPDVIHIWSRKMIFVAGINAILFKIPWLIREQNSLVRNPNSAVNRLGNFIARQSKTIVTNSNAGKTFWEKLGYKGKIIVVRNALPYLKIKNSLHKFPLIGINEKEKFILYAGRLLDEQKNIINLFYAFLNVVKTKNIKAIYCGEGLDRKNIERLIHKYHLSNKLILSNNLGDNELWTLMKKAKVFVSVSHFEGCPNTVLEAMACGTPLVLSDIPEHREILDDQSAWFCDQNNPDAIAQKIIEVLNSPKKAIEKTRNARKIAKNWPSIKEVAEKYEKIYHNIFRNKTCNNTFKIYE